MTLVIFVIHQIHVNALSFESLSVFFLDYNSLSSRVASSIIVYYKVGLITFNLVIWVKKQQHFCIC